MSRPNDPALVVVDLGFGDAGKGTVTDFLVRHHRAHTVVRFNGGAQAGHNVVLADGRHHTFAHFGAGTFVPGTRTHLSRQVVIHPTALLVEAHHLATKSVTDALDRVTASEAALVTTPFQQAANRLRELARGDGRHGSCGVGVGETMADALAWGDDAPRARDLVAHPTSLARKLREVQRRKREELGEVLRSLAGEPAAEPERRVLEDPGVIRDWIEAIAPLRGRGFVVPDDHLSSLLRQPGAVVFEGAQGVLIDEWRGFHPYTTWSTCTFDNALELLREHGPEREITRIGLTRTYAVRHGPGPFPTETPSLARFLDEPHNGTGPWQGAFRVGWLDLVLLRYALEVCGGADTLALTHLDALAKLGGLRACRAYRAPKHAGDQLFRRAPSEPAEVTAIRPGPFRDLAYQERLSRELLNGAVPVYEDLPRSGDPREAAIRWVGEELGVPVGLVSEGPRAEDKRLG